MKTYTVYEIQREKIENKVNPRLVKFNTVLAMSSESARRKAIIGTDKEYSTTRAYAYTKEKV
jgi:hypothetical protein|tara:strand:- start:417 stop:602 length:186 start_codon:yes stop_codon:yes gene_type:complete